MKTEQHVSLPRHLHQSPEQGLPNKMDDESCELQHGLAAEL